MISRRKFLTLGALLAAPSWAQLNADGARAAPRQSSLPLAIDLAADSRMASERNIPLLVLYSLPGCPYCEAVRRSYLLPLLAESTPRALVRQIDVDSSRQLIDFEKRPATHQAFATREGITLTPVVAFYGPAGKQVAARMVGAMLPDFYGSYLDEALSKAADQIKATKQVSKQVTTQQNPSRR